MVPVKLPYFMSLSIMFENMLSIRVLEWLVILVGCKIKGINELDATESKNSFAGLSALQFIRLTLKFTSKKIGLCSLEFFSKILFK